MSDKEKPHGEGNMTAKQILSEIKEEAKKDDGLTSEQRRKYFAKERNEIVEKYFR
jgi:hypothetical protein